MGARVSAITKVGRRTPSGHGSAVEQRATGRAEMLTSFSCHMCIQYSTQELQDVSLYKTSSDIMRRRLDYSASSYKLGLVGRGPRESGTDGTSHVWKGGMGRVVNSQLACIQSISTHAANTVTGH